MGKFQDIISLDISCFLFSLLSFWTSKYMVLDFSPVSCLLPCPLLHFPTFYQCFSFISPFAFSSSLLISCQLCLLAVTFIYLYINFSCSAISHFHFFFFFTIFTSLLKSCHLRFYSSDIWSTVGLYFFYWISINSCFTLIEFQTLGMKNCSDNLMLWIMLSSYWNDLYLLWGSSFSYNLQLNWASVYERDGSFLFTFTIRT